MVKVKIQRVHLDATVPKYAHDGDAGMDLHSCEDYILKSKERKLISTGIKIEIEKGYEMQIRPRSGLALKYGVSVLNTPGTIDSGYRGEVGVILINTSDKDYEIKKGDRIAQAVVSRLEEVIVEEVNELSNSLREEGGFGSTGH